MKKKVTGIGGVFLKCSDPSSMYQWYSRHLGIESEEWGATFEWRRPDAPEEKGTTAFSFFKEQSSYFDPSSKPFMLNFRVENLEELLEELKAAGIQQIGEVQVFDYGKFAHILDPEGNKLELWEPVDSAL